MRFGEFNEGSKRAGPSKGLGSLGLVGPFWAQIEFDDGHQGLCSPTKNVLVVFSICRPLFGFGPRAYFYKP